VDKRARVDAAVRGEAVDRPPVAAWRHFLDQESNAGDLAAAMVGWLRGYDWDFLKINPRATYAVEAWSDRYDSARSRGAGPTLVGPALKGPADLARVGRLDPGQGPFGEQLEAVRLIAAEVGDEAYAIQTVFSPLSYLLALFGTSGAEPGAADRLRALERTDAAALHAALDAIAATLADYAGEVVRAGASGLFFAVVKLARSGQLTAEEYRRLARPYDRRVLAAVRGAPFTMLHVCGDGVFLAPFADYPVQAVNWDVLGAGNPSLAEGQRLLPMAVAGATGEAGVLQRGTPDEVASLVRSAIEATGGRRLIVAPGCSAKPPQSEANLRALRRAVEPPP
jgi:uroporphyrinogen decarboxylase